MMVDEMPITDVKGLTDISKTCIRLSAVDSMLYVSCLFK